MSNKTILLVLAIVIVAVVLSAFAALVWFITWPLRIAYRRSLSAVEKRNRE